MIWLNDTATMASPTFTSCPTCTGLERAGRRDIVYYYSLFSAVRFHEPPLCSSTMSNETCCLEHREAAYKQCRVRYGC